MAFRVYAFTHWYGENGKGRQFMPANPEDLSAAEYENLTDLEMAEMGMEMKFAGLAAITPFLVVQRSGKEKLRWKLDKEALGKSVLGNVIQHPMFPVFLESDQVGTVSIAKVLTTEFKRAAREAQKDTEGTYGIPYDWRTAASSLNDPSLDKRLRDGYSLVIYQHLGVSNEYPVFGWVEDGKNLTKRDVEALSGLQAINKDIGPAWDWVRDLV